jgi:hypothetical protein
VSSRLLKSFSTFIPDHSFSQDFRQFRLSYFFRPKVYWSGIARTQILAIWAISAMKSPFVWFKIA